MGGGGGSDYGIGSMVVEERSGARILIGRVAIGSLNFVSGSRVIKVAEGSG